MAATDLSKRKSKIAFFRLLSYFLRAVQAVSHPFWGFLAAVSMFSHAVILNVGSRDLNLSNAPKTLSDRSKLTDDRREKLKADQTVKLLGSNIGPMNLI